ncbi:MAG: DNA polymerase III subunit gamma and tau [Actinobacteria bacterium]|nr:DNA polymerase III subunit gamma and tau [Actinomycetota bacterium]
MALYRTYRPASLDAVVGQDHVTGPLRRALENDRVNHAYLFSGPRGCGKTSTARILARSLNCAQGPTPNPCGECQSCLDLAANGVGSIDVIELDAASHGGVEDTRDLRERAMFAPASSRYKIYIIDEAHMVTTAGFNALLKLVEEPPDHVRFIFATTEVDKVLPTIRSRTHNYTFRLVSAKVLAEHLASVCAAEGVPADPAALALVARAGAGSVRDSLSILSQVISGCGPEGVTYAEAVAQLGMTDGALLDETVDAMAAHDGAALFMVVDRVMEAGHEPRRFATDLLERLRDLIVLQHVPHAVEVKLIDAPEDQVAREVVQAAAFGAAELARAADVVSEALSDLRGATAPRLHLELMAARLLLPASDADERGTRARLDQLERRMSAQPPAAAAVLSPASVPAADTPTITVAPEAVRVVTDSTPAPAQTPPAKPASTGRAPRKLSEVTESSAPKAQPPEIPAAVAVQPTAVTASNTSSDESGLAEMRSMWPAVLDALKTYSRVAWMAFANSAPISLSNGVLAVAIDSAGTAINIRSSGHDERLRQAILDVMRRDVKIDVVLAPNASGAAAAAAAAPTSAAAEDAPPAVVLPPIEVDAPSIDDEDAVEESGVDLVMRTLGATQIGEIQH